ncbi:MAG: DUF2148 domain-containing protein [Candidatus Wallbacteria bacterium]
MSVLNENTAKLNALKNIAEKMVLAAITAPKGCGKSNMSAFIADKGTIIEISHKLKELGQKFEHPGFLRDAENILAADYMVLLGSRIAALGLKKCGLCGFADCGEKSKYPLTPCVFNTGDLGIAIGSAVSVAMDNRVDNRIMYTVGQAVLEMNIFDSDTKIIYGIPLSASPKNPFFDRK